MNRVWHPVAVATFLLTGLGCWTSHAATHQTVPLFPSARSAVEGFVRVVNQSQEAGSVRVTAVDDSGVRRGEATLALEPGQTRHFNSKDLENGNANKGLSGAVGAGTGDWRLQLASELKFEAFAYLRAADDLLSSVHDLVVGGEVAIFNPASNSAQVSELRLVNTDDRPIAVTIRGVDDSGRSPGGDIELSVPAGAARTLTARQLEAGSDGIIGMLGDGVGKWRLTVSAERPVGVMSLLRTPTGHLTNLSTAPAPGNGDAHAVHVFAAADDAKRQGFVRVINPSAAAGDVEVTAIDDNGRRYGPVTLTIGGSQVAHFNSNDLENGNLAKGFAAGVGDGEGDWRLSLASDLPISVHAYMRTSDGFLTSTHDLVPRVEKTHHVPTFNPASNTTRQGRLRLVNPGDEEAQVTIRGVDDSGAARSAGVRVSLAAGASRTFAASTLESGGDGVEGGLGDGVGKWRLTVESEQPIDVLSLLSTPAGHLANLSTRPDANDDPRNVHIPDDKLREAIAAALDKRPQDVIGAADMEALAELRANNAGIRDLTGMQYATGLALLDLKFNQISDIGHLARLTGLRSLTIWANAVSDISAVAGMTALEHFDADRNGISDISPLRRLTGLRELYLHWNRVADISVLAQMPGLRKAHMFGNRVSDLSALSQLTELTELGLAYNAITDVSPLSGLTSLSWLHLGNNTIEDIAPLARLTGLGFLALSGNLISDISPLRELISLGRLELANNRIVDISALAKLEYLEHLDLDSNLIVDISVLAGLPNIAYLHLSFNRIVDISPLAGLRNLLELTLEANQVASLEPLTRIEGRGASARVNVRENPLDEASLQTHIPALRAAGMTVQVTEPYADDDDFPGSRLTMLHNDNVLVLHVPDAGADLAFDAYARDVYRWFEDSFDYLLFLSNLDDVPRAIGYYGVFIPVMNDTSGLGQSRYFDRRFGSGGKLRGVIHFPYRDGLLYGPGLHELLHAWGNFVVPTANGGHWGFSSADGQLGGFRRADLVSLGAGRYSAGYFGTFANGGNGVPYSPIELYFAGYIPPEEVPDLWVAPDGAWVVRNDALVRTEDGHGIFTANDVRDYAIEDLIAEHGPRVPAMADAPWGHRAAVVFLVDDDNPATDEQLEWVNEQATVFSNPQNDDSRLYNYFEATGGRGTITMDGLATLRKGAASDPRLPPSFGTAPPPQHCWLTADGRVIHRPAAAHAAAHGGKRAPWRAR